MRLTAVAALLVAIATASGRPQQQKRDDVTQALVKELRAYNFLAGWTPKPHKPPECNKDTHFECIGLHYGTTKCFSKDYLCDTIQDCKDWEDENDCKDEDECDEKTHFECQYLGFPQCRPNSFRCDRISDCDGGVDEEGCPDLECKENEFNCTSFHTQAQTCFPVSAMCNQRKDCDDSYDEADCDAEIPCDTSTHFRCTKDSLQRCFGNDQMCDGWIDCDEDFDELNCDGTDDTDVSEEEESFDGLAAIADTILNSDKPKTSEGHQDEPKPGNALQSAVNLHFLLQGGREGGEQEEKQNGQDEKPAGQETDNEIQANMDGPFIRPNVGLNEMHAEQETDNQIHANMDGPFIRPNVALNEMHAEQGMDNQIEATMDRPSFSDILETDNEKQDGTDETNVTEEEEPFDGLAAIAGLINNSDESGGEQEEKQKAQNEKPAGQETDNEIQAKMDGPFFRPNVGQNEKPAEQGMDNQIQAKMDGPFFRPNVGQNRPNVE